MQFNTSSIYFDISDHKYGKLDEHRIPSQFRKALVRKEHFLHLKWALPIWIRSNNSAEDKYWLEHAKIYALT